MKTSNPNPSLHMKRHYEFGKRVGGNVSDVDSRVGDGLVEIIIIF